jgi:hypothetical protein
MTPAQQSALESAAGKSLTPEQVAAIEPYLADRNDVAIAALLPPKVTIQSTPIGIGTILAVLAPHGGTFLDALETLGQTDSNVKWAIKLIEQSNFDVGLAATRAQMVEFAQAAPSFADGISALLATAERWEPIPTNAVSDALNIAEGRMVL